MIDIEGKIRNILVEQLGAEPGEITRETVIVDDLGADSLDQVELLMACEEEFGIEIPDGDAEPLTTFGAWIDYVERRLTVKAAAK